MFLGAITDENSRTININFDFLDTDTNYEAILYKDGENAHWNTNPLDLKIEKIEITNQSKLTLKLAEGGGLAISIIKK